MLPKAWRNLLLIADAKLRIALVLLLCAGAVILWMFVKSERDRQGDATPTLEPARSDEQRSRELAIRMTPLVELIGGPIDPSAGEQVFKVECGPCHKVDRDMTGPALKGAMGHAPQHGIVWLKVFLTREDSLVRVAHPYTMALRHTWGDVPWMHSELELSEQELRDLLGWIWLNDQ